MILAKRLSPKQIEEITNSFINGIPITLLSEKYSFTKLTISRNLKKHIGEKKYNELIEKFAINKRLVRKNSKKVKSQLERSELDLDNKRREISNLKESVLNSSNGSEAFKEHSFVEIAPLNCEINAELQKDISSIPISSIDFPKVVYMIVDKKIELEIKLLKEYPEWHFLPNDDLKRKTIEIFYDIKNAKRACNKEQKVIKVPNTNVFKIVAPILIARGISRIINNDKLISL